MRPLFSCLFAGGKPSYTGAPGCEVSTWLRNRLGHGDFVKWCADKPRDKRKHNLVFSAAVVIFVIAVVMWRAGPYRANTSPPSFNDLSGRTDADFSRLDTWLQEQVDNGVYPSVSIAIADDEGVVHAAAFGWADRSNTRRATTQTLYQVASVTKVYTATLAAMLHENGVIDLDMPVASYLPGHVQLTTEPERAAVMTLRHLALHSSGLTRSPDSPVQTGDGTYRAFDPEKLYRNLAQTRLKFDPGADESYSNLGYGLLAHCMARHTGKPYADLLAEYLLNPLALEDTAALDQEDAKQQSRSARRYDPRTGRDLGPAPLARRLVGSGGLVSTPSDVARFGAFYLRAQAGGEPRLSAEAAIAMTTPQRAPSGRRVRFGWDQGDRLTGAGNVEFPSKSGGRAGVGAYLLLSPEPWPSFAVAVALNADVDEGMTKDELAKLIMSRLLGLDHADTSPPAEEQGR